MWKSHCIILLALLCNMHWATILITTDAGYFFCITSVNLSALGMNVWMQVLIYWLLKNLDVYYRGITVLRIFEGKFVLWSRVYFVAVAFYASVKCSLQIEHKLQNITLRVWTECYFQRVDKEDPNSCSSEGWWTVGRRPSIECGNLCLIYLATN